MLVREFVKGDNHIILARVICWDTYRQGHQMENFCKKALVPEFLFLVYR